MEAERSRRRRRKKEGSDLCFQVVAPRGGVATDGRAAVWLEVLAASGGGGGGRGGGAALVQEVAAGAVCTCFLCEMFSSVAAA